MKVGSLCECINKGRWLNIENDLGADIGPKYGELTIVDGIKKSAGVVLLTFLEYPDIDPSDGDRYWFRMIEPSGMVNFREVQPPMNVEELLFQSIHH